MPPRPPEPASSGARPPRIAIVGASKDRAKFGNKSIRAHLARGWTVHPIHPAETEIEGCPAHRSVLELTEALDRVALYVPAPIGVRVVEELASRAEQTGDRPEVWINPGAGSPELRARATELGIPFVDSCAIVAIGESPSSYR